MIKSNRVDGKHEIISSQESQVYLERTIRKSQMFEGFQPDQSLF